MSSSLPQPKILRIPMRDGIHLCARFHCPGGGILSGNAPYPLILNFCTDWVDAGEELFRYFSQKGFVCLELLFRGRGESEGIFSLGKEVFHDLEDFFRWLGRQRWYGGRCGIYASGVGATFSLQFSQSHPELIQGLVLSSFLVNYDSQGLGTNGVFNLPCLRRLLDLACTSPACRKDSRIQAALQGMQRNFMQYARYWPFAPGSTPLGLLPEYEEIAQEFIRSSGTGRPELHRSYTSEQFFAGFPGIPLLLFGQWNDDRLRSVLKAYYELSYRRDGDLQCFITSGNLEEMAVSGALFFQTYGYRDYVLGWFQHYLCRKTVRQFSGKNIYYQNLVPGQVPGTERSPPEPEAWEQAVFWPPEEQEYHFYLQKNHCLTTLGSRADSGRSGSTFFSDPRCPALAEEPDFGDPVLRNLMPYLRGDTMSFLAPPLKREIRISGNVLVRIFLHCTAPDGDLYCRLSCREPSSDDGGRMLVSMPLCESIQRFSHYQQTKLASMRDPGYCRLFEFSLSPVAAVLPAGSRLQLDLAGSHFPRYAISNQTGIADLRGTTGPVAYYRVYHNQQCPSCIILPVRTQHGRKQGQPSLNQFGGLQAETITMEQE